VNETTARRIVRQRSGGDCELRIAGVCEGRATNLQHRKNRSQGGQWTPSNGLDVCGTGTRGCHGFIHQHPAMAREKGWTVPSWADPEKTPVEMWMWGSMQVFALLDNQGCAHLHQPEDQTDLIGQS
jgi:hypothetical protein